MKRNIKIISAGLIKHSYSQLILTLVNDFHPRPSDVLMQGWLTAMQMGNGAFSA